MEEPGGEDAIDVDLSILLAVGEAAVAEALLEQTASTPASPRRRRRACPRSKVVPENYPSGDYCVGCGRKHVPLVKADNINAHGAFLADLHGVVTVTQQRQFVHRQRTFRYSETPVSAALFCGPCLAFHYYCCRPQPSAAQKAKCQWPSLVAHLLSGTDAEKVWRLLPPALRNQWTESFPTLALDAPGPKDGMVCNVIPRTAAEFVHEASKPWDTKCAVCRTTLINGDHLSQRVTDFDEGDCLRPHPKRKKDDKGKQTIPKHQARPVPKALGPPKLTSRPLAIGWEEPSSTVMGKAWTRAYVYDNTLCFAVCNVCAQEPKKLPFLSPKWPEALTFRDSEKMAFPSNNNLAHLNPVRLCDNVTLGARLNKKPDGSISNARYHTMRFSNSAGSSSTQMISLSAEPISAHRFVTADPEYRQKLHDAVVASRKDLHPFFKAKMGCEIPEATAEWKSSATEVSQARIIARQRQKVYPAVVPNPSTKHHNAAGPEKWITPLNLPRSTRGGLTALMHLIMGTPMWREHFLNQTVESVELTSVRSCVQDLWKGQKLDPLKWADLERRTRLSYPPGSLVDKLAEWFRKGLANLNTEVKVKVSRECQEHQEHASEVQTSYHHILNLDAPFAAQAGEDIHIRALQALQLPEAALACASCSSCKDANLPAVLLLRVRSHVTHQFEVPGILSSGHRLTALSFTRQAGKFKGWTTIQKGRKMDGGTCWFQCYDNYVDELGPDLPKLTLEAGAETLLVYTIEEPSIPSEHGGVNPAATDNKNDRKDDDGDEDEEVTADKQAAEAAVHQFVTPPDDDDDDASQAPVRPEVVEYELPGRKEGLHVLLSSLAEVNMRPSGLSNWVRAFTSAVTAKLPEVPDVSRYLEAYLFTGHFPHKVRGHFPGCMPLDLYSYHKAPKNNFVPFHDYVKQVLCDADGTRGADPSWIAYAFNVLLAQVADRGPSMKYVKKGLEAALKNRFSQKEYAERFGDAILPNLLYDEHEAKRRVKELCSAIQELDLPTYFFSLSCNQKRFPGVSIIHEAMSKAKDPLPFAPFLQRTWHRVVDLFLNWLQHGEEKPLGDVKHIWARHEFQADVGNLSHVHFFVWNGENVGNPDLSSYAVDCAKAVSRITATIPGAFVGKPNAAELETEAWQCLVHNCCPKCMLKGYCRHGAPWPESDAPEDVKMKVEIPPELQRMLLQCKLATIDPETGNFVLSPLLAGTKHCPSRGKGCSRVSIFSPECFALTRSHHNVQVCNGRFVLAYLVKYCAEEEERCVVSLTQKGPSSCSATLTDLQQRKRRVSTNLLPSSAQGETVSVTEMLFHALGLDAIYSTFDAIHVNSGPAETRFVTLRPDWIPGKQYGGPQRRDDEDPSRCGARGWHEEESRLGGIIYDHPSREPHPDQITSLETFKSQRTNPDQILKYCVRPPELYHFKVNDYYGYTVASNSHSYCFNQDDIVDWFSNGLYDLRGRRIFLRPSIATRPDMVKIMFDLLEFPELVSEFLDCFNQAPVVGHWFYNLVDMSAKVAIVVHPQFSPSQPCNWWIQKVLLSVPFGDEQKVLERELPILRASFPSTEELVTRFVTSELRFWPVGYRVLFSTITSIWANHNSTSFASVSSAPAGEVEISQKIEKEWEEYCRLRDQRHEAMLYHVPAFERHPGQSDSSWEEQSKAWKAIEAHFAPIARERPTLDLAPYVLPLYISGPPGSGKTFLVQTFLRAICRLPFKLNWEITSLSANRACELGGEHIHHLFGFRVPLGRKMTSAASLAASAYKLMLRQPAKLRVLQELRVLVIDEFCQVGSVLLTAIDTLLRKVRRCDKPFGGVAILACGDHYQTEPIGESCPLLSSLVRFHFSSVVLTTMYRSRADDTLQWLIQKMRKPRLPPAEADLILSTLESRCKFYQQQSQVPSSATWLLSKKVAVEAAREKKFNDATQEKKVYSAEDLYCSHGTWTTAEKSYKKTLDRLSGLSSTVPVILGEPMKVTVNTYLSSGKLVPNGSTGIVRQLLEEAVELELRSGERVQIRRCFSQIIPGRDGVQLKRLQLPLELACASTIHDSQGATVLQVATCASSLWEHRMWSRQMLFTLISRVESLSDICFVGYDRNALRRLLAQRTHWHSSADSWLFKVNILSAPEPTPDVEEEPPFYDFALEPPPPQVNTVYILESRDSKVVYVGSSDNMVRRLRNHNSSWNTTLATAWTKDWTLQAYVLGFPSGTHGRDLAYKFEHAVQHVPTVPYPPLEDVLSAVEAVIFKWKEQRGLILRIEQ